jgi:hydroxyacylglutathione hydrolase
MTLLPLPAFSDNYIWFLHDGRHALVVDPGDAQPVLDALARLKLTLQTILVTHHHADHVGGVDTLRDATGAKVYGPAFESIPEPVERLSGGDTVQALGYTFKVSDVPGHTSGHIAYLCDDVTLDGHSAPLLFCGDTLFSGGCGRLFEGTPAQMLASLSSFAVLPGNTRVCATHEYTLSNLRFARAVEPGNADLVQYEMACVALRAQQQPTLPSSIAQELLINPFLRSHVPAVIEAALSFATTIPKNDPIAVFAAVREWKNQFK